jgi:hypothetical protein
MDWVIAVFVGLLVLAGIGFTYTIVTEYRRWRK